MTTLLEIHACAFRLGVQSELIYLLVLFVNIIACVNYNVFFQQMVMTAFMQCSYPLYISLLMKNVVTWTSNIDLTDIKLTSDATDTFASILSDMESSLGVTFVSHALSYITVADGGLSEVTVVIIIHMINLETNYAYLWSRPNTKHH